MNLSGTINTFRLLYAPRLARPHVILSQFSDLTFPLGKCIVTNVKTKYGVDVPEPDIRAIVIDKDNCIAKPHALEIWPPYKEKWQKLVDEFGNGALLVVSNTAGTAGDQEQASILYMRSYMQASVLEKTLGAPVLRHSTKKPGCSGEVIDYFLNQTPPKITKPDQILVIGDRMLTDVMLGNFIGCWTIWFQHGVIRKHDTLTRLESTIYKSQNLINMLPKFPISHSTPPPAS